MFSDKVHWPNLVASGNLAVDPGFGSSIDNVVNANSTSDAGLFHFFKTVRENSTAVESYGYKMETVPPGVNWIPQWPLPELTDMQYANTSLRNGATDGQQIGDRGWFHNGFTGVRQLTSTLPGEFSLSQAYPNPFNPSTNVQFSLAQSGVVSLRVYNILGQLVKVVVDNLSLARGTYSYRIDMQNVAGGVYYYTLHQGSQQITRKMVLVK